MICTPPGGLSRDSCRCDVGAILPRTLLHFVAIYSGIGRILIAGDTRIVIADQANVTGKTKPCTSKGIDRLFTFAQSSNLT